MGTVVNKFDCDEKLIGRLQHWLRFGYLRPEQGISLLVGLEADDKSVKVTTEWGKNKSSDNALLGVGITLLNGDEIKLTPNPNSVNEEITHHEINIGFNDDHSFEEQDRENYEISEAEFDLFSASMAAEAAHFAAYQAEAEYAWAVNAPDDLEYSRRLVADRIRKYKVLLQYWESDKYKHQPEENHDLWYFVKWAKSKKFIPEWMPQVANLEPKPENSSTNSDMQLAPVVMGTSNKTNDNKPWFVANTNDPKPDQPWYTPARYFARQLVKDDSTLLIKRDLLSQKIHQSLISVGIKKRGGEKEVAASTILKALSNVSLG